MSAGGHDERVADLEGDVRDRRHHHQHAHRGQAVEAVDDVDGVRHAGHDQQGQRDRERRHRDQVVDAGNRGAVDHAVEQEDREPGGDRGEEEAAARGDALRQVFGEAEREGRQARRRSAARSDGCRTSPLNWARTGAGTGSRRRRRRRRSAARAARETSAGRRDRLSAERWPCRAVDRIRSSAASSDARKLMTRNGMRTGSLAAA